MKEAYSEIGGTYWNESSIESILDLFPEGQLCVLVNNEVAASALSIIVDSSELDDEHTYKQVTGNYSFCTHAPIGDVLYIIEVFVHPKYRGMRLGRRLYDARKELCENLNLGSIMPGGRIPNHNKYSKNLIPRIL